MAIIKEKIHIFLDLDGVLADFDRHAHEHGKYTEDNKPKWEELDYQWWVTMPACEGAKEFYDATKKMGTVNFLTAPVPGNEDSYSGKAAWIKNFVPERGRFATLDLIICRASDKVYLAGPDRILVDDREKNIKEWQEAGGIGIHHNGDFTETLRKLQGAVGKLTSAPPAYPPKNRGPGPA